MFRKTLLAASLAAMITPCAAQQMVCRDGAAISELIRMNEYSVPVGIEHMLASCRPGDLIRVNPIHVDVFCDMAKPVVAGGYGLMSCTLGTPRRYRN
jgi:hypothetical protein